MAAQYVVYYCTGVDAHTQTFAFDTADNSSTWCVQVGDIKHEIVTINERPQNQRAPLYRTWITHVMNFRNQFGGDKVPRDIKESCDNVKRNLNLPTPTQW